MARFLWGLLLAAAIAGCSFEAGIEPVNGTPAAGSTSGWTLAPGDRVDVAIEGHEDLSGTYVLDADGGLELPSIGRIDAYGASAQALEETIVARLAASDVRRPEARVEIASLRPFFILGDVRRPGSYAFVPGMTIAAAILEAGGALAAEGGYEVVVSPGGRARDGRVVQLDAELSPGDVIELKGRPS